MQPETDAACVFCRILRGDVTPGVVAFRDALTAVFPASHQQARNRGHMLVVPVRHVGRIWEVDAELAGALMTTLARVAGAVKSVCHADGVSVRQNNDPAGGQSVFHVHFHVIPRFAGDEFDTGEDRFPFGAVEVPIEQRIEQAKRVAEALSAATEKH